MVEPGDSAQDNDTSPVPPPPDPAKVRGQVIVDVVCLILTAAVAYLLAEHIARLRRSPALIDDIPVLILAAFACVAVVLLGVFLRAQVRLLFGVSDTARQENEPTGEPGDPVPPDPEPDDLSEPTVCLVCATRIPAGEASCPRCGWTYRRP